MSTIERTLEGKTCLVTGASSGIGREIARGLLEAGGRVVLACRDRRKATHVRAELSAETGNHKVDVIEVDAGAPHGFTNGNGPELGRRKRGKTAEKPADRCPNRRHDDRRARCISH